MTRTLSFIFLGGSLAVLNAETITSPDGTVAAEVSVTGTRLSYSVTKSGVTVIETSPLGFTMNGSDRGDQVTLGAVASDDVDESFTSRQGIHAAAKNRYHGKRLTITHTPSGQTYVLNVRAYDSGVAIRYEVTGAGAKNITAETTSFILPAGSKVWSQAGNGVYENPYSGADISSISTGTVMGPPVVAKLGSGAYVALTESASSGGFPNPYLTKQAGRTLQVSYPKNGDNTTGASTASDVTTPWNVISTGTLDTLVNSDMVEALAPAPDPTIYPDGTATAWAKPGRSVWDWMSRFPGGITAENSKLESYWANQLGFEYNTIDEGWAGWNNNNPWPQVAGVTAYAAPLGVKILLWSRSSDLQTQALRTAFFNKLKAVGVAGCKIDFFDFDSVSPAAKERVALMESILKEAAALQLVIDLHGTSKPIGQFRTFPNLLNIEAVYGKEQYPGASVAVYPALTRFLAGPADYTPLGLQGSLQGSQTQAFEIASAVNMTGPLITIAERGDRVAQSPFAQVMKNIPNLWDETKVLQGSEVGDSCAMARRKGDTWYVAIMNANSVRNWSLPLTFLTPGTTYQTQIVRDGATAMEYSQADSTTTLTAATSATGGFVARFTIPSTAAVSTLPFITSFDPGRGSVYAENGQILSTTSWANNLLADRLPDAMWTMTSVSGTPTLTAAFDETDPYQGGASIKVTGTLGATHDLPLYRANLAIDANTKLGLAFKRGATGASGISVGLTFADSPTAPVFLDPGVALTADWNTVSLNLSPYAGRTISAISLRFSSAGSIPGYSVKIGRLGVYDAPLATVAAPASFQAQNVVISGLSSFNATLTWTAVPGAAYYSVYQTNPLNGARGWLGVTAGTSLAVQGVQPLGDEQSIGLQVVAVASGGPMSTAATTSVALPPRPVLTNPLSGAVIGTTGSFQNSGSTRDKAFDGDVTSFFDAANSDGVWTGIDLGAAGASRVTALRYYPRDSWSDRMVGGQFQGANQSSFSDAVTLATVSTSPTQGAYALVAVSNTQTFRYLRYLSPNGGWGNVAEVQFYGPAKPGAPTGVKADRNKTSAIVSWQAVAGAQTYQVKRSTISGGPYTVVGTGISLTSFTDATLTDGAGYYYVVSAVSTDTGEGANSAEVAAIDGYAQWSATHSYPAGSEGFAQDADGNGISNGFEYAVPAGLSNLAPGAFTFDLRMDPFLAAGLFRSPDLAAWTEVTADASTDQTGVADGFLRLAFHDTTASSADRQFYRLQVSR